MSVDILGPFISASYLGNRQSTVSRVLLVHMSWKLTEQAIFRGYFEMFHNVLLYGLPNHTEVYVLRIATLIEKPAWSSANTMELVVLFVVLLFHGGPFMPEKVVIQILSQAMHSWIAMCMGLA